LWHNDVFFEMTPLFHAFTTMEWWENVELVAFANDPAEGKGNDMWREC
jgi:hypothetical protein